MKNKIILTFLILLFLTTDIHSIDVACADEVVYYRIVEDNTKLFRTSSLEDTPENVYFELPKSYFVKFAEKIDEQTLKVVYDGIEGFVLSSNLLRCYSEPTMPYASLSAEVLDVCNVVVYNTPSTNSEFVGLVPFGTKDLKVFGTTTGEQVLDNLGQEWLFVRYKSLEQGVVLGYAYAPLLKDITQTPENTEEVQTSPPEVLETVSAPVATEFKNTESLLLIVGLSAVALVIVYLLFKPERKKRVLKTKQNLTKLPPNQNYIEKHIEKDEFDF